jgi:RimJ/RimL family protein N-acetyltransferase
LQKQNGSALVVEIMVLKVIRTSTAISAERRDLYLKSLAYSQELYIENLVPDSASFEIYDDTKLLGYALIHAEKTIIEFHINPDANGFADEAFSQLVSVSKATNALCKSFDDLFVTACSNLNWRFEPGGFMYRRFEKSSKTLSTIPNEPATTEDINTILEMHDGFFDGVSEILSYLEPNARLFKYHLQNELIGCGIIKQINAGFDFYDIGYVVKKSNRQKGIATHIAVHLKEYCLAQGWKPVAGCNISNIASQKTLQNAGFISEHTILNFSKSDALG